MNTDAGRPGFQLRALSPAPLDSECPVPGGGLIIGRDPDLADLVISSSRVSRIHCRIHCHGQQWLIEDLESTNGVFVNGCRIDQVAALTAGDVIGLGRADPPDFVFSDEDEGGRTLKLPPAERWVVGRSLQADIALPADPTVSQQHLEIRREGEQLLLRDLDSLNGVRIDGRAVGRGRPHRLEPDASLILGNTCLSLSALEGGGIEVLISGRDPGLSVQVDQLDDPAAGIPSVDERLEPGALVAIRSRDGQRANALLEILAGRRQPARGQVLHNGLPAGSPVSGYRVGYVEADHPLDGGLTVWQHLDYTARLRLPPDMDPGRLATLLATTLAQLGLEPYRNMRVSRLDATRRRLTAIAAELVTRPALLCLEDPFAGLDAEYTGALLARLRKLARTGATVIFTDPRPAAAQAVDRVIDLNRADTAPAGPAAAGRTRRAPRMHRDRDRQTSWRRIRTLLSRQCRLRLQDVGTLTLYLLLPVLLTLAVVALAGPEQPLVPVMMMVAMATAVFTTAPEVGSDRWRLRHEVHAGVKPGEDLVARMLFCGFVTLVQVVPVGAGMAWLTGMNLDGGLLLVGVMALVAWSAAAMGLMVGTIDPTRARLVMPLAAAFVVLQWIALFGQSPDPEYSAWLFGRVRDLLPAWWGVEFYREMAAGLADGPRPAIRAAAFLAGQTLSWLLIARGLLGRRIRRPGR